MSPEEIDIAIAEFCGYEWRVGIFGNCRALFHPTDNYLKDFPCRPEDMELPIATDCWSRLPHFNLRLDAIHDAEMRLENYATKTDYAHILGEVVDKANRFYSITAKAAQRAEALLKTIGKWKD